MFWVKINNGITLEAKKKKKKERKFYSVMILATVKFSFIELETKYISMETIFPSIHWKLRSMFFYADLQTLSIHTGFGVKRY